MTGTVIGVNPADTNTTGSKQDVDYKNTISFKTTTPALTKLDVSKDTLASGNAAMVTINNVGGVLGITGPSDTKNYMTVQTVASYQEINSVPDNQPLENVVSCPAGYIAISGGAEATDSTGKGTAGFYLTKSAAEPAAIPSNANVVTTLGPPSGWRAAGYFQSNAGQHPIVRIKTYAICVKFNP